MVPQIWDIEQTLELPFQANSNQLRILRALLDKPNVLYNLTNVSYGSIGQSVRLFWRFRDLIGTSESSEMIWSIAASPSVTLPFETWSRAIATFAAAPAQKSPCVCSIVWESRKLSRI